MTISQKELTAKAEEFIVFLAEKGLTASLDPASFRDYNCKLLLPQGKLTLYHKPSKKTFSIGTQECKSSDMEALWHAFMYPNEQNISGLCAYVDGSFFKGRCAWGLVLAQDDAVLAEKSGLVPLNAEESSRQIAGEITAVLEALAFANDQGIKALTIFFDYLGLQHWAEGSWKAQSAIAQFYCAKLMQYRQIKIRWHKVKAHTGHPLNSMADRLAKEAASRDA